MDKIVQDTPASVTRAARAVLRAAGLLDAVVKVSTTEGRATDDGRSTWSTDVDMVRSPKSVEAAVAALSAAYPGATVKATEYGNAMIVRVVRPHATPGRDERFADGRRWAETVSAVYREELADDEREALGMAAAEVVEVNTDEDRARQERTARQRVAELRRQEHPELRTWAPGDELPTTPPPAVFDVDGYVWEHIEGAGRGMYRMSEASRELLAAEDGDELLVDVDGARLWPHLLDLDGPVTETVPVRELVREPSPTLPRQPLAPSGRPVGPPLGVYNGHEFSYEGDTDLFRCDFCRQYEVTVKAEADQVTGEYPACAGFPAYDGDLTRVYLLLTINPDVADRASRMIADGLWQLNPVIGRTARFGWNPDTCGLLVETAPGRVDELHEKLQTYRRREIDTGDGGREIPVVKIEKLTTAEGLELLANNYAAYVAKYGTPVGAR